MQFDGFELKKYIVDAISDLGFVNLMDVQKRVLTIKNKNVIIQSPTGSGKTHAFLMAIFNNLQPDAKDVQAVILAPTKELSRQIFNNAKQIASKSLEPIDIRLYQGGDDRTLAIEKLNRQPTIVVGTPGRLKDLIVDEKCLFVHTTRYFIIDEADMVFDSGFMNDVLTIKEMMNEPKILVFSATILDEIRKTIFKVVDNVDIIKLISKKETITHSLISIKSAEKKEVFMKLTKCINPYLALVFLNTKERATAFYQEIKKEGLNACLLHGGLNQRERKRIMKEIVGLRYQYIVCSDIAARGIDIEGVSHVINYDLPSDYEFYIHRTGRTGRANFSGNAISLYDFDNKEYLKKIEEKGITFVYQEIKDGELVDCKKKVSNFKKKTVEKNTPRYKRR